MSNRLVLVAITISVFILIITGCTPNALDKPVSVESQLSSGEPIYAQTCATNTCHGTQGEGIRSANGFRAWPLVGDESQTRHPTAQIVFDVIRSGSERNLLALNDQQIYDASAYQLSQNQIVLDSPLTVENAFLTFGGTMSGAAQGGLIPPSDNVTLIDSPVTLDLPIVAQNKFLRLQLDQIAQTDSIGSNQGIYLILVVAFSDLDDNPITLSPDYITLTTPSDELLKPQSTNIHSAIEKFHMQTIKPRHGTVGLIVFMLSTPDDFDQLIYDDGMRDRLTLALKS